MNRVTNGNNMLPSATMDKSKDWQLELLMEKLRSKASQFKNFTETSKSVRMAMLDKRYALDSVEKSQHQKCLDTLQQSIKVTSLQRMVEKLECLTRQLGLKFVVGQSGVELFISSDMFYLEINLDQAGTVKDVKVHHEGKVEQQSCAELVSCLSRGDFADFTAQLEGFASIYQLNAEKKIKAKAFTALQSLEADLSTLAQLQTFMKEPFNLLHKSPVGILEKRRGGHPMRLTYFVSPYDLIDVNKFDIDPISIEAVTSKSLGYSVTVCMEGSAAHKLQTTTLITVNRNMNGMNTPSFTSLNSQNSAAIPAYFVLKLNKPMPMCVSLVRQIQQLTELECAELSSSTHPLLSLIVTHASNGKLEGGSNKGLFVTLPDQQHCYFLTENKNMEGILVHSIPFTHPCHVSQILVILRQQALFNTIITSCVRQNARRDLENMMIFEVSALSWTHLSISLEHPIEESMATAEIDLTDISNLVCRIHSPGTPPPTNAPDVVSELATKVLNRCFSIPVTMRSVIKHWDKQVVKKNHFNGHENFSLPLGPGDPGGHKGSSGNGLTEFEGLEGKIKQEPSGSSSLGHLPMMSHSHPSMFLDEPAVLTNVELTNILQGTVYPEKSSKKQHKRKTGDDAWKNSRRKLTEDPEMLLETSSSDSTSRSTPLSQETVSEIPTPNSALGFHSDLELSGLDPAELMSTSDKVSDYDELGDMEEMLSKTSRKIQRSPSSSSLLMDLGENKNLVPPSVSITPIPTSNSPAYQGGSGKLGIEIIPITTTPSTTLPSSITITPIPSSQAKEERSKEKKSSKNRSEDKNRLEKRRKRKRDESSMGPPDKLPPKQDPLTKPVTVSIKPAESPPSNVTPTSPSLMRKFSPSPTQNRSLSGKLSPSMMKSTLKPSSAHQSPKHSPIQVSSSPKHNIGICSPKSSPKHPSTSGSGKPSMSTLKSAANSPSSKISSDSSKSKLQGKESSRDKEKKSSLFSISNCSKVKTSSGKLKSFDASADNSDSLQDSVHGESGKSAGAGQVRNRKGSLSAVIDKLKSAQHCDNEGKPKSSIKTSDSGKGASKNATDLKNSEYMVKPSSDGMKLTINKTRTKDSTKSSSVLKSSGTGSPKTHTGLKPGVNSGPASKKPQQQSTVKSNVSNSVFKSANKGGTTSKSPSLGASLNKPTGKSGGSPKTTSGSDTSRSKPKVSKSSSEKSIFSSKESRRSSPTQSREEADAYKLALSKMDGFSSPLMMEGLMKQLDKNFQIPKLSARNAEEKKPQKCQPDTVNNVNRSVETSKSITPDTKYPVAIPANKMFENVESKIRNNMAMLPNAAQKEQETEKKCDESKVPSAYQPVAKPFPPVGEPLNLLTKSADLKFVAPAPKDDGKKEAKCKNDGGDALDFSSRNETQTRSPFPQSPSVSVHIVKSPAPSPLVNPSPHSASPCITDDELMDEALVGLGK